MLEVVELESSLLIMMLLFDCASPRLDVLGGVGQYTISGTLYYDCADGMTLHSGSWIPQGICI